MELLLGIILFFVVFYYLFRFFLRYMLPWLLARFVRRHQKRYDQHFNSQQPREGDVNLKKTTTKRTKDDTGFGEYVDYEEIDDNQS